MNIKDIRKVSTDLTLSEIETCVEKVATHKKDKSCPMISFDDLIKAEYVRRLMENENMKQNEAIRKLASNIRNIQTN